MSAVTRERWQRASALFEQAIEIEPTARVAWLDDACAGDAELRADIERLLAADEGAGDFLEAPIELAAALDAEHDASAADAPRVFGVYRTVRSIGAGGMGEVWLAERIDGEFEQRVAIKRLLYPTAELTRRFRSERRTLAALEHPHIARLLDGGVAGDGSPYFVMELVEGVSITSYCDVHALDVDARLELFLQVCEAVRYAHRKLVVHRDLKPSNILVDANGTAKLLDFGIAKVLESTDSTDATVTMLRHLTPDYAAPEQIRGEAVTTQTDVYALGVLLFELLAGERPYRLGRRQDIARAIVDVVPPLPSAVAARSTGQSRERARALRGDLDRVVLTALAKEPERRYASVDALMSDIESYRVGRPVQARGGGAAYRARKFVQRNRTATAAVVVVALALVVATIVSLDMARRANAQARRAQAQKNFVLSILDANDPNDTQGHGQTMNARQILERAAERIDTDLADEPAVRAGLYNEIGNLFWDYGLFERSRELSSRAVALGQTANVPPDERVRFYIDLGGADRATHRLKDSEADLRAARAFAQAHLASDAALADEIEGELCITLTYLGDYAEAERIARAAMARRTATNDLAYAGALDRLAFVELEAHRYLDSARHERQELAIYRAAHTGPHSQVSTTENQIGVSLIGAGDWSGAETALHKALDMHIALLGKTHPHYGGTLGHLAEVADAQGKFREAQAMLEESQRVRTAVFGADSPDLAAIYEAIATNARHRGDLAAAAENADRALRLTSPIYGARHVRSLEIEIERATIDIERGHLDGLDARLRETIDAGDAALGPSNDISAYARALLGRVYVAQQRFAEADALFADAVAMLEATLGANHARRAEAITWRADAARLRGDVDAARELADAAVTTARAAWPVGDALIADTLVVAAKVDVAAQRFDLAAPLLREALSLREAVFDASDSRVADLRSKLAQIEGRRDARR